MSAKNVSPICSVLSITLELPVLNRFSILQCKRRIYLRWPGCWKTHLLCTSKRLTLCRCFQELQEIGMPVYSARAEVIQESVNKQTSTWKIVLICGIGTVIVLLVYIVVQQGRKRKVIHASIWHPPPPESCKSSRKFRWVFFARIRCFHSWKLPKLSNRCGSIRHHFAVHFISTFSIQANLRWLTWTPTVFMVGTSSTMVTQRRKITAKKAFQQLIQISISVKIHSRF